MTRLGATVWTGDINPTWDDLRSTPGMVLNWGLGGAPYVACDIGGFTSQTTGPLLTRWMQLGAFMPTMRVHSTHDATPHFPFLWPEPYRSHMRDALNLRYQLLPFHYSLAHRMRSDAVLWMRPLAAEWPDDAMASQLTSQWLDGSLLIAPVMQENSSSVVYLPTGTWYRFNSSTTVKGPANVSSTPGLGETPVYAPAGAVVPLAPVVQSTDALPGGPLEVHVYGGADGRFVLVEDDGETMDYATKGLVRRTALAWDDAAATLSWTVDGQASGGATFTQLGVTLFVDGQPARHSPTVQLDGKAGSVKVPPA